MASHLILVVDDDHEMRLALSIRLKALGYGVVLAVDGVSAMSEARKQKPDLILLDLGIPAGDGYVVLDRLKSSEAFASIPVVVVSGKHDALNRNKALDAGAKAFLQKPVLNSALLATIRTFLQPTAAKTAMIYDIG